METVPEGRLLAHWISSSTPPAGVHRTSSFSRFYAVTGTRAGWFRRPELAVSARHTNRRPAKSRDKNGANRWEPVFV